MATFVEQLLGGAAGEIVTVAPDYVVINDGVSSAAVEDISTAAAPEKILVIYDHDVPTGRPEAAEVLKKNFAFAKKFGTRYIQAEGIGYQYLVNEVVQPGQIIVGGGSHGGIYGAKGALGIDVSIPELARVVETNRYSVVVPETVYAVLEGTLSEGVSVMDAALTFLRDAKDLKRKAVEFYCPTLDLHEREVLLSMACMTGAFTAGITEEKPAQAAVVLPLNKVVPMLMLPCGGRGEQKAAEIVEKASVEDMTLQAGQIGGYTGGTIEELRKAAKMIEGKRVAWGFRLSVCPATSRDYLQALEEGIITKFIDFGAQIHAAGDRSVVVQGPGAMGPQEKLLTTGLYTFAGAMGCEDAEVYTASTESVMQAAISKQLQEVL